MVAAKLANIGVGQFVGTQHVASANLQTPAVSQSNAAEMLNVSTRTMVASANPGAGRMPTPTSRARRVRAFVFLNRRCPIVRRSAAIEFSERGSERVCPTV